MNGKELRNGDLNQTVSLKEYKKGEQFNLSLHFSEVNTRHAGNFTCEAQNKYHKKERNIQVSITCPPMFSTLTTLPPRAEPGGNAILRCEVYGLDHQKIYLYHWQWKFQEVEIKKNTKYTIFYRHQPPKICQQSKYSTILQIKNVSNDDLGQYTCALQLSNTTLTEKNIPFYDFATDDRKHIFNLSSEVHSHEFVGLNTNAVYEVNLRAKNADGFGLWAKEQLTTTADVPGAFYGPCHSVLAVVLSFHGILPYQKLPNNWMHDSLPGVPDLNK
ncbi:Inactive tyrosine-protein kinase 7 [Desmophyllum pertusum]|uniref:Inactive tyrosine-protein kinase 7 n=1 Tax=Desmophyllum pertusum TaxID=174260 RepID=A0A9W9YI19_9CNID|nr:Inactive tyrosine-protein kinase 7 [Desmophyllum pertusum]